MSEKPRKGFSFSFLLAAVGTLLLLAVAGSAVASEPAAAGNTVGAPAAEPLDCITAHIQATRDSAGHVQVEVTVSSGGTVTSITGDVYCDQTNCGDPEPLDFVEVSPGHYLSNCSVDTYPGGRHTRGHVTIETTECDPHTFEWRDTTAGECQPLPTTPTTTPTETLIPTETPTAISTASSTPANTPTFTLTPVSTGTIAPTNTPVTPVPTATRTATFTPVATATVVGQTCISAGPAVGSIANSDPIQTGRLNRDGVQSTCEAPKTAPPTIDALPRHYDTYSVANTTRSTKCFTVDLDAGPCTGGSYLFSAAYRDSFNPNDLTHNYLADIGTSPNPRGSYSFALPAGARAIVVVHTVDSDADCPAYGISISTCPCLASFADVSPVDYFYTSVQYLYCHTAISGYSDNTFRPYNNTTRGQLAKIVALAMGWPANVPQSPTFRDVPAGSTFYSYVETAYEHQVISGYSCGAGCLEFRPNNSITRAQLSKIIVLSTQWPLSNPAQPTFRDVSGNDPFYQYVETAYAHSIISGYTCGSGCLEFRPGNNATRGQISKIVYGAITAQ